MPSCKGIFGSKNKVSPTTGWEYNNPKNGGFEVSRYREQETGPGLVFIEGGTFVMGQNDEDIMLEYNNPPRRVTVRSFYMDETEVTNLDYLEYLYWLQRVFVSYPEVYNNALPDTLVWRERLSYNEPLANLYLRHPAYHDYPVVGVTWIQANDYCSWRSDRVNEMLLIRQGILSVNPDQEDYDNFNTDAYLKGQYDGLVNKALIDLSPTGTGERRVRLEDGILLPKYRLPTEAEWEYAAYGILDQNPAPRKKEGKSGAELISNQQIYSWSKNPNGMRDTRHGSWQGRFLANFKRGSGDNMGIAGGLNDRAAIPGPVKTFYPNAFGLYNMSGNVNEWVGDVYRPMTSLDAQDFNYFRGNKFQKYYKNSSGEFERDSMGRLKKVDISDEEVKNRSNYQRNNVINYMDGDSASQVFYGYGVSSCLLYTSPSPRDS